MVTREEIKANIRCCVYLQHHLAVVHVRLSEAELQQLHVADLPEDIQE